MKIRSAQSASTPLIESSANHFLDPFSLLELFWSINWSIKQVFTVYRHGVLAAFFKHTVARPSGEARRSYFARRRSHFSDDDDAGRLPGQRSLRDSLCLLDLRFEPDCRLRA